MAIVEFLGGQAVQLARTEVGRARTRAEREAEVAAAPALPAALKPALRGVPGFQVAIARPGQAAVPGSAAEVRSALLAAEQRFGLASLTPGVPRQVPVFLSRLPGVGAMSLLGNGNGNGFDLGGVLGALPGIIQSFQRPRAPVQPAGFGPMLPGFPAIIGGARTIATRALPAIIGGGAVAVRAGARRVLASAMTYCRRHPQWCLAVGGLGAIQGMIESGQLPPVRRRRGRGITPRDFRAFSRVHRTLSKFCAGPARGRVRAKPRR